MRLSRVLRAILLPLAAIAIALAVGAVLIWLNGSDPRTAYKALLDGSLGSKADFARTLARSTPLILHRSRRDHRHGRLGCSTSAPRGSCCSAW